MKPSKFLTGMALVALLASAGQGFASELQATYLKQLKAIHEFSGNGSEKQLVLIRRASIELEKEWSPPLAKELARVFNELLNANQNYFLVELLQPMAQKRAKQFGPILEKALSPENRKLYEQLIEMDEREEREGNG